jgi:Toprim domain
MDHHIGQEPDKPNGLPMRDAWQSTYAKNTFEPHNFPAIVKALLGDPVKGLSTPKCWRYGTKGGLSVDLARGVWFAHDGGQGGGALDLVVYLAYAKNRAEAVTFLQSQGWLSEAPFKRERDDERQKREHQEAVDSARKQSCAKAIWEASEPLKRSLAWVYLTQARAIFEAALSDITALRFHPACYVYPYSGGGVQCPAMVAQVVDSNGAMIGVHVTFLAPDGLGKADLPVSRKMIGAGFSGACVRLNDGPHVVIAEGIESALSAGFALGLSPIAALSAGGVKSWLVYDGVASVTFAPDMDASEVGTLAAYRCADRLHSEGVKVVGFAIPPDGANDWNDYARAVQS